MAKESLKAREVKRAKLIAKYADKRAELKKIINGDDYEAKAAAIVALQKLPPNSNPIRLHNRCSSMLFSIPTVKPVKSVFAGLTVR